MCQCHRQRHRRYRLASANWICVHPVLHPRSMQAFSYLISKVPFRMIPIPQTLPRHHSNSEITREVAIQELKANESILVRYLVLSGISPLAHEARQISKRVQIHGPLARPPHHRRPGLLLLVCQLSRGAQDSSRGRIFRASLGLLRSAQNQASQLRGLDRNDRAADVRHQQYVVPNSK